MGAGDWRPGTRYWRLGTGDSKTGIRQTVRLQRGVLQNVFPNNRDRAIESGEIFQFPSDPRNNEVRSPAPVI